MFVPKIFRTEDAGVMQRIIAENAFATLISNKRGYMAATHSMFMMRREADSFRLHTHISRANPQAKSMENGDEVLCDFLGAHSYISSSWYRETNVSTWNYEAVQIYGTVDLMSDADLYTHLEELTLKYESIQKCPMTPAKMGRDYMEKEMRGALGLKIMPTQVFIKQKLSQNRNPEDFQHIIENLEALPDTAAHKIAEAMRSLKPL